MADERTVVKPVELLGVWTGRVGGLPYVFLSLRIDMGSFEVTNLAISASQARRLLSDLTSRFEESALLKGVKSPDPELRLAYDRIISEEHRIQEEEPPRE